MADSKIKAFNGIVIRGFGGETLGSSFVEENGCRISHYTFEVTGTLDSIRQLAASFDKAQQDNRFYIVRSVFLYGQDEDLKIKSYVEVKQVNKNSEEQADQPQEGGLFGGGRSKRSSAVRHSRRVRMPLPKQCANVSKVLLCTSVTATAISSLETSKSSTL